MIKIHGALSFTHDCRPRWLLHELEVPFEQIPVDIQKGDNKKPDYLKKNPSARVPYMETPDVRICESGAIVMVLADQFPEKGLAPDVKSPLRPMYNQWFFFGATTLEIPSVELFANTIVSPNAPGAREALEKANRQFDDVSRFLEYSLDGRRYLLGSTFSAADIMVGSTLYWAKCAKAVDRHPTLNRYIEDLMTRPAFKKTFGS